MVASPLVQVPQPVPADPSACVWNGEPVTPSKTPLSAAQQRLWVAQDFLTRERQSLLDAEYRVKNAEALVAQYRTDLADLKAIVERAT